LESGADEIGLTAKERKERKKIVGSATLAAVAFGEGGSLSTENQEKLATKPVPVIADKVYDYRPFAGCPSV
jgi:hypothetical protein